MVWTRAWVLWVALLWGLASGCAPAKVDQEPKLLESAQALGYAESLPGRLEGLEKRLQEREAQVREDLKGFAEYGKAAPSASGEVLRGVYEAADDDGHSQAMVEHMRQRRTVEAFLQESESDLTRRVSGAVQAKLKKDGCGCEANVGGSVRYAVKEEVDEQMALRQRGVSRAFALLEQAKLDKKEAKAVEEQLPKVIGARFFVSVEAPELHRALRQGLDELDGARETLQAERERLKAELDGGKLSGGDRKEAEKRLADVEALRQKLDEAEPRLKPEEDDKLLEAKLDALAKDYDVAFDGLLDGLKGR